MPFPNTTEPEAGDSMFETLQKLLRLLNDGLPANLNANLAALAGNTVSTLDFSNVNLLLARLVADGGTKEHQFILSSPDGSSDGANVALIWNKDATLYSAFRVKNHLGDEMRAFGFGNASAAIATFAGWNYDEFSDADHGGSARGYVVVQSTTYEGAVAYGINPRYGLLPTGEFKIAPRSGYTGLSLSTAPALVLVHHTNPIITLGLEGAGSNFNYGEIRAVDSAAALALREAGANKNGLYTYGGTLAAGLGHRFFTGGLRGDQTVKLQVADDGVAIKAPATAPSTAFNSSVAFYLDEGAGAGSPVFKVKAVSSNGTIKTGSVTLA